MPRTRRQPPPPSLSFNSTPLIDVIFTLTIFFMLVSRFASNEQVVMELPKPRDSLAEIARLPDRVVINCRVPEWADATERVFYSLGPNAPEALSAIAERVGAMHAMSPALKVLIRADRRLSYAEVRPVMRLLAERGVRGVNVAALTDDES